MGTQDHAAATGTLARGPARIAMARLRSAPTGYRGKRSSNAVPTKIVPPARKKRSRKHQCRESGVWDEDIVIAEFEVIVAEGVNVRDAPGYKGNKLALKRLGDIVVGAVLNGWVKLCYEEGYMCLKDEEGPLLELRSMSSQEV